MLPQQPGCLLQGNVYVLSGVKVHCIYYYSSTAHIPKGLHLEVNAMQDKIKSRQSHIEFIMIMEDREAINDNIFLLSLWFL